MAAPTLTAGRRFAHAPRRPRPIAVPVATNPAQPSLRCAEMGSGTAWRADRPPIVSPTRSRSLRGCSTRCATHPVPSEGRDEPSRRTCSSPARAAQGNGAHAVPTATRRSERFASSEHGADGEYEPIVRSEHASIDHQARRLTGACRIPTHLPRQPGSVFCRTLDHWQAAAGASKASTRGDRARR